MAPVGLALPFPYPLPVHDYDDLEAATGAEAAGYTSVWIPEISRLSREKR